jgi:hypothetical protein
MGIFKQYSNNRRTNQLYIRTNCLVRFDNPDNFTYHLAIWVPLFR